jgi:hypothetical protein
MIDTASINFGINKLSAAFSAIQPKVSELTTQFIQYKVTEQIAYNIFALVCIPILLLLYRPIWKYGKGEKDGFNNYDEIGFIMPTILFSILIIFAIGAGIGMIPDSILAIKFPEMFTIQSMLPSK